jgi:nickel-dependent lactate racemase
MLRGKQRVLIVTDDFTRQTPLKKILPALGGQLRLAGISDSQVKILIASGTHRSMSKAELRNKLGPQILSRFKVYQHRWDDSRMLASLNPAAGGRGICVNKLIPQADFIIGVGSILPHATCGFSGGGKIILPGVCARQSLEEMHWKALDFRMRDILGVYDNPMRRLIDAAAREAGLKFIVNTVIDNRNRVAAFVCGDPERAHRKGAQISRRIFGRRFSAAADIVVADARPMDVDLRQAIKAVAAADLIVKDNGVIILLARCPEGVSAQFPEFEKYGFSDAEGLKKKVEEGKIKGKLMAYTLIAIGRVLKKAKVILVSRGIPRQTALKMGFLWQGSLREALKEARGLAGKGTKVVYLKRACEALPLLN